MARLLFLGHSFKVSDHDTAPLASLMYNINNWVTGLDVRY